MEHLRLIYFLYSSVQFAHIYLNKLKSLLVHCVKVSSHAETRIGTI